MAFRKRNIALSGPGDRVPNSPASNPLSPSSGPLRKESGIAGPAPVPGVRPSPLDGRPTVSTGVLSLDGILAGHAGLALGNSVLIEETGMTDYAGTLLRYYAAEGVVQKHMVHVVGMGEAWGRELPGLVGVTDGDEKELKVAEDKERMKIAWRYERLGYIGKGDSRAAPLPDRGPAHASQVAGTKPTQAFCHSFDLTKRLTLPSPTAINFLPLGTTVTGSPFTAVITSLQHQLSSTLPTTVHRLVIPTLLSPAFYPPASSMPQHVLQFLHSLRSLLRQYSTRLTAMISLPITLYPRETGLTRWMELLSDGVVELIPFPHTVDVGPSLSISGAATAQEEKPQGMAKIHRLPVFHERGGGGVGSAGVGDDLAFTVSRKRFTIKPFSLPPVEGDSEAQRGEGEGKPTKMDIDF